MRYYVVDAFAEKVFEGTLRAYVFWKNGFRKQRCKASQPKIIFLKRHSLLKKVKIIG